VTVDVWKNNLETIKKAYDDNEREEITEESRQLRTQCLGIQVIIGSTMMTINDGDVVGVLL
jgi:hypothetical protein